MPVNTPPVFTRQSFGTRAFTSLCCALLVALTCRAQDDGGLGSDVNNFGNGGRNTIQGRIYLPSGRRPEKRMRVRLSSVRNESSTMTDDTGSFTFRRLAGGAYRITVDAGRGFEVAAETVDIFDAAPGAASVGPGQTFTVQIRLEPKATESPEAAAAVNAALASVPRKARESYEKAQRAARTGDHRAAVEHLKKAVGAHPDFPVAHNELGVQYTKLGELEKASGALREAVRLAPDAPVPRLNLGAVLIVLNRLDEAERELREALRLGGDALALAHRYLGAIHIERGEHARAAEELETYLRLAPDAKDAARIREMIEQLRAQAAPARK